MNNGLDLIIITVIAIIVAIFGSRNTESHVEVTIWGMFRETKFNVFVGLFCLVWIALLILWTIIQKIFSI